MTNGWKWIVCGVAVVGTLASASSADAFGGRRGHRGHHRGHGCHGGVALQHHACDPCAAPVVDSCGSHGGFAHQGHGFRHRGHHGGGWGAPAESYGSFGSHGGVVHAAPACDSCHSGYAGPVSHGGSACDSCHSGYAGSVSQGGSACESCHSGAVAPASYHEAPPQDYDQQGPTDAPPQPSPSDEPQSSEETGVRGGSVLDSAAVMGPNRTLLAANDVSGQYVGSSGLRVVIGMPSSDKPTYGNYGRAGGPNVRYRSGLRF